MPDHPGPQDFNELAHGLFQRMSGEVPIDDPEESPQAVSGRKGGEARAKALTAAERTAIAAKGGKARWSAPAAD